MTNDQKELPLGGRTGAPMTTAVLSLLKPRACTPGGPGVALGDARAVGI